jgi:hypothetical protein
MGAEDAGQRPEPDLDYDGPRLAFLLTGTARSGTTLVQRLACELSAVWVPQETHFWARAAELAEGREWPLRGDDLRAVAEAIVTTPAGVPLPVSPRKVVRRVDDRDRAVGLWTVFESLVAALSPRGRMVLGEKTPAHTFWWERMRARIPDVRLITVVRHPADVYRSHLGVPWGEHDPHALAERWIAHQRIALDAHRIRGPEAALILRYEDVVAAPDEARDRIAAFLGVSGEAAPLRKGQLRKHPLFAEHESWKERALAEVGGRRPALPPEVPDADRRVIEAACTGVMAELGYEADPGGPAPAPPEGDSLEKVMSLRRWHASVGTMPLPIY